MKIFLIHYVFEYRIISNVLLKKLRVEKTISKARREGKEPEILIDGLKRNLNIKIERDES